MPWPKKDGLAKRLYALYQAGLSLAQIAEREGLTRQSVFGLFKGRGWSLRTMPRRSSCLYNGQNYTLRNNGYFGMTTRKRTLLHRDVWEHNNGSIPDGWDVHHRDGNKLNNEIANLECLPKADHTRIYSPHHNQYTKRQECGSSTRT